MIFHVQKVKKEGYVATAGMDFQIYLKEEIGNMSNKFDIPNVRFQDNRKV